MRSALLLLVVLTAPVAWGKDLAIRQRVGSGADDPRAQEETVYFSGNRMVTDNPLARTIVDLNAKTVTVIDKTEKTYAVMTFADLDRQADEMRKHVDELPPEARDLVNAMMSDKPVKVTPTGKTETIAGHEAKEYRLDGAAFSGSIWASEDIDMPPEMVKWKELGGSAGSAGPGKQLGDAMSKVKGMPLRITIATSAGGQGYSATTEALDVSEKAPPAEVLKVPADFTKATLPSE